MNSLNESSISVNATLDIDLGVDMPSDPDSGAKNGAAKGRRLTLGERIARNRLELEKLQEKRAAKAQEFKDAAADLKRQIAQGESAARAVAREHRKTAMRAVLHHLSRVALESAKRSGWSGGPLILQQEDFDHILAAEEYELIVMFLSPQTVGLHDEAGSHTSEV